MRLPRIVDMSTEVTEQQAAARLVRLRWSWELLMHLKILPLSKSTLDLSLLSHVMSFSFGFEGDDIDHDDDDVDDIAEKVDKVQIAQPPRPPKLLNFHDTVRHW
jgi:hypothetical protein